MNSRHAGRRVLVVDDHPLYRDALAEALQRQHPGLQVEVAGTLAQVRNGAPSRPPCAMWVADQHLPDGQGLELLLECPWPETACVLVSGLGETALAARARRLGLRAFLPKTMSPARMLMALTGVLEGRIWFDATEGVAPSLTERQIAVLQRAARGQSNREIGLALNVSERTIKDHMTLIFQRLGAATRAEAVALAAAHGLIVLPTTSA